jgi:glycosyltransferase involved in cell wall biosynthesis
VDRDRRLSPRIALAFPGDPLSPQSFSGIPAGIAGGLRALGTEVVPVRAAPPEALHRRISRPAGGGGAPPTAPGAGDTRLRPAAAARRRLRRAASAVGADQGALQALYGAWNLRGAAPLDGVLQIGTGYVLRGGGSPRATFDDMTVAQAVRQTGWSAPSKRALRLRLDRQRRAYEDATVCCFSTAWAAASAVDDYGIPPEKTRVVGFGRNVDLEPAEKDWRRPRFLFVGRDWELKNGPRVVRVFARLRRERSEATLDVVGTHPPLDEEGVTGHGTLRLDEPAELRRLQELYTRATCLVVPSYFDASPIVTLEAAAAGIPSIGTSVGGGASLMRDGGVVVDPHDDDALLDAMRRLSDPRTAAEMGARALARAPLFTWRGVAGRFLHALGIAGYEEPFLA